jgi:peptidoglycan hydrolase-like protein with peptidoglycan-binding domain
MSKVQALGDIGLGWSGNSKIVRLIQHGLFCKGYWGADTYGTYDSKTTSAVTSLRLNMGLPDDLGKVNAKVLQCILNMDAYVVLAGGTEKIRGIQQWLNGRYWLKDAYSIGPCDGIYSRDVQKSLLVALQYELGIAAPNGNFGPGTQAALRNQTVQPGNSGILVQLFSAACVFNEPVPGNLRTSFTPTYNTQLTEFVKNFQMFSQLAVNGSGDYQTWAQLLVSMGDPERPVTGCDTRFEITPSRAKWLKDNHYGAVARYLYDPPGSTLDKEIKAGELNTIFSAGLKVLPVYQDNARLISDFTYSQGYQHAIRAHQLAAGYGFNRGTVIYFAVDYDATQEDIDAAIIPYFQGVQAGLASNGKKYVHGVYGSRNVCLNVTAKTFARYSFVSGMSWGFSGNLGFPLPDNWSFNQIKEFSASSGSDIFDLDNDVWRASGGDPGQASVKAAVGPADAFIDYVQRLYNCAIEYGSGNPNQLVMEFIRSIKYANWQWEGLIGGIDKSFKSFAESRGFSVMQEFQDPFTGYTLGADHLMATANGHFLVPQPENTKAVNAGDIAGWGGDLLTFYRDWRDAAASYSSGHTFCMDKLAQPNVPTSFGFSDLVEDADGYLIAGKVRGGVDIVRAVREHYVGGGGIKRFSRYYAQRFVDAETCNSLARNILTAATDPKVVAAQIGLTMGQPLPTTLPYSKLQEFVNGFADTLLARVGMES